MSNQEKRKLQGDLTAAFLTLNGAYKRDGERLLTRAYSGRTRGSGLIRFYAESLYCDAKEVLKQVAQ